MYAVADLYTHIFDDCIILLDHYNILHHKYTMCDVTFISTVKIIYSYCNNCVRK